MTRKAFKVIGMILGVIVVLIIGFSIMVNVLKKDLTALGNIQFKDIDISAIENGKFHGEYQVSPISVKLDVYIENGKFLKIDLLEHKNGKGKPAEAILQKIIDSQKINVDSIAGATYSSNAIKKAIEISFISNN